MRRAAAALAAAVLSGAVVAAGCGVGPGESSAGEASLTITRDYGAEAVGGGTLSGPTPSDTVVRFLDDEAEIGTSYGGNFVDSIDGLDGSTLNGGGEDWFFFVNGIFSDIGAGESKVHSGDRIWWDYRRWAEAYRVPAVVGSWPEPFLHGYGGERYDVVVECLAPADSCDSVVESLRGEGVEARLEAVDAPVEHPDQLRVLVGEWDRLRSDPAARTIEADPGTSGVFAEMARCGDGWGLSLLADDAKPRRNLSEAGLVAAVQAGDDKPTWLVTATDAASLPDGVALLDADSLRDRYAVAASGGEELPIPAPRESAIAAAGCG